MLKNIYNYILDTLALIGGIFFQAGSERFDKLNTDTEYKNQPFIGHSAVVIENVTRHKGKVRYGGVVWEAKLHKDSSALEVNRDTEVQIKEVKGNVLVICRELK